MTAINTSFFKILRDEEIEQIHQASMYVLKELGVKIDDLEMRERLHGWGCTVEGCRVRFTPDSIEETLANVKREITFTSRTGNRLVAKPGNVLTHSSGGLPFVIDLDTGQKRNATSTDVINTTRLMNKLAHLDMPGALVYPADVPSQINQVRQCELLLRYSEKPVSGPGVSSAGEAKYIAKLFQAVSGAGDSLSENPIGDIGISPESPLYFPQEIIGTMKIMISAGIPTVMLISPVVGLSAPMTIAGGLVQMNASMLAFAAIAYLINPETPVIYGARLAFANMHTGSSIWGVPDIGIAGACAVQIARYYGFLSDVYGLSTTACAFDNQAGYEKAMNGLLPLLARANRLSGFGGLTSLLVASYEQLVIDNETFSALRKIAKGVVVNKDTMALDVIANVLAGENYLEQEHTIRHLRGGEVFIPELGFKGLWNEWEEGGQKNIRQNAREYARQLLKEDDSEPLPPEVDREMTAIMDAAYAELVERRP